MQGVPANNSSKDDAKVNDEQPSMSSEDNNQKWSSFPEKANLLCTPVLMAVQGVSRRERLNALGSGMESDQFKRGQVCVCMRM